MKKIAVILSGCGNRDGSELQETLSLLLAIDLHNYQYQCFAPKGKFNVVSYLDNNNDETGEKRDIFAESARIARGNILDLKDYKFSDYDALVLPGGMGAARNWSDYAFNGAEMTVLPELERAILATHQAHKPICAVCIAPMVLAKVLGPYGVTLTLGDPCTAKKVATKLGANCLDCNATEVAIDTTNKVITTPAYMVATHISQIFEGATNLIDALVEMLEGE